MRYLTPFISILFLLSIGSSHAQVPFSWKFILDGYNDVWMADVVVDSAGNSYVGVNYMDNLIVPGLNKILPRAGHVHSLIVKLNQQGKPIWAHAFKSSFDNRINDLALTPGGDLLVTGFGDGQMHFPGVHDTMKLGKPEKNVNFNITRYQGFYVAKYSPEGERKWARYFDCAWGEGTSIAANKKNEIWLSFYYQGSLRQGDRLLDSIPRSGKIEHRLAIAKLDSEGFFQSMFKMNEGPGSSPSGNARIRFDNEDNAIVYGNFSRRINITPTDSLTNDGWLDGQDSYIAKLNNKGRLLWSKKLSGQSSQGINDLVIAPDNSIYATGFYSYECAIGDGVALLQKSKYEYRSGYSFFYVHLLNDGELDFIRFEETKGSGAYLMGNSIALDTNGYSHIVGYFTDTVVINGEKITTAQNYTGYYSQWDGRTLQKLGKAGTAPHGSIFAWKIGINNNYMAVGGDYYGNDATLINYKGSQSLSNKDYGRAAYVFGGNVHTTKKSSSPVNNIDPRKTRLQLIKTFQACTLSPLPDFWMPIDTSSSQPGKAPCGQEVKGMEVSLFPNPTKGEVKIKLSGITGRTQIEVFSLKGQLLHSHSIEDAFEGQVISLNLHGLSNATYIVRVTHKNFQKGLKVVKIG